MNEGKKTEKNLGGRPKGVPNKTTMAAREAIAKFVDGNASKLQGWLKQIAEGDPKNDIKPNPAKAFELFQSVVEYHVPKLARTELTGAGGKPIEHEHTHRLSAETSSLLESLKARSDHPSDEGTGKN